jgi:hypothetical protein
VAEFIEIKGIGQVEVESKPAEIPSKVKIGDKWVKIDRNLYLYLWATTYGTAEGHKKLGSII